MEKHAEDARRKAMVIDIDMLVPKDHLLRKIEKVMDYDWLYERLNPLYNDKVGRPGTDPVVLIKMVLIQHLFGIPSLRQTWRECDVNVAYRWFLGYDLLEHIPHFATVSYALLEHNTFYLRDGVPFVRARMDGGSYTEKDDTILPLP
ncbi:transposase [Gemmiger formicilis]|uniref:transposase n=1 Tax=Gemmiger formicilis TaxID=745368 RepID=UPI003994CDD3